MSLTSRGAVVIGGATALIVAGLLKIDGAMIAVGAAGLILLLFSLLLGRWNLSRISGEIECPARVFADQEFDLRLHLKNSRTFLDAHQLEMKLLLSEKASIYCHHPWIASRSFSTVKLRGSIPTRGAVSRHLLRLSSDFPLGLLQHRKNTELHREILIFPKPLLPLEFFATGEFDDAWHGEGLQAGNAPGEPRGLRPFRPGDPAKNIHWPATMRAMARGRNPRIRETDPPGFRPRRARVIFHSYGTDGALIRTDFFERGLSLLCGALQYLRSIGIPATLSADFLAWRPQKTFQSSHWRETLAILARAKRANDTEAHDLLSEIHAISPEEAIIILSDMPPEGWESALGKRPKVIIDVRQHRFANKNLNFRQTTELAHASA